MTKREPTIGPNYRDERGRRVMKGDPIAGWARIVKLLRTSPYDDAIIKDERMAVLEAERGGVRVRVEIELLEPADLADQTAWVGQYRAAVMTAEGVAKWGAQAFVDQVLAPLRRKALSR